MSNHQEEQALEVEALTSIFEEGKEFIRISETEFCLKLLPYPAGEEENHVGVTLHVTYTDDYPDSPPEWALEDIKGLNDPKQEELRSTIEEAISSSLGMAMIYTVAEACQDFLKQNNQRELSMHEEMLQRMAGDGKEGEAGDDGDEDEDEEEEENEEEEEWKGLAEKTLCEEKDRISMESFAAWKVKFDAEMIASGLLKRDENKAKTGKQFFLEASDQQKEAAKAEGGKDEAPLVYDAALFGENEDDLDDLSGGED
uniref:RWD domain-containing protein n=1 Tax=Alexandrium monilatum TaxID=311494 RepID=A0A6T1MTV5_9DINO|mmetsp:Transcript_37389/g.111673  ORF Transcript_37389/g.111673 Transcript_37389/m.111673 type:complete len:256 (+) Transcript_37389:102-869(+)